MTIGSSPLYPNRVTYICTNGNETTGYVNPHNGDAINEHGEPVTLVWDEDMVRYYELGDYEEEES